MPENILIAIAWPYANAEIHVGNITGSHLPGDIVGDVDRKRLRRLRQQRAVDSEDGKQLVVVELPPGRPDGPYERLGWPCCEWQDWHSTGPRAVSMPGFEAPCGAWQIPQFSTAGACSQRYGPRFSAWHS